MSKIMNSILEREKRGDIQYNHDKAVYQEFRDIMQGKSDKILTKEHQEVVEREHKRLVERL